MDEKKGIILMMFLFGIFLSTTSGTSSASLNCTIKKSDILFVVDASGSIGSSNFEEMRRFILKFIDNLNIGPEASQVGLIKFCSSPNVIFTWTGDKNVALQGVRNMIYTSGGTYTSGALYQARQNFFARPRPDALHLLVLITDGASNSYADTVREATALKNMKVNIMSVGIGTNLNIRELRDVSSENTYYDIASFALLFSRFDKLIEKTCIMIHAPTVEEIPKEWLGLAAGEVCPPNICSSKKGDIVFLIESSTRLGEKNFYQQLDFLLNIIEKLDIGIGKVQVTLITFNVHVKVIFKQIRNKQEIVKIVRHVQYTSGQTATGAALKQSFEEIFTYSQLGDSRLLLLVGEGTNTAGNNIDPIREADNLKNIGVNIVAIGVGAGVNKQIMETISSPKMSFYVNSANDLGKLFVKTVPTTAPSMDKPQGHHSNSVNLNIGDFMHNNICPPEICLESEADLVFVLDVNDKIGEIAFQQQVTFLTNLVTKLSVGSNQIRISLITFSSTTTVTFEWEMNKQEIISKMSSLSSSLFVSGKTLTGEALRQAREKLFLNSRLGVKRLLLMLTGETSSGSVDPVREAEILKNERVKILSIGIGQNVNRKQLEAISSPNLLYIVKSYEELSIVFHQEPRSRNAVCPKEICSETEEDLVIILDTYGYTIEKYDMEILMNLFIRRLVMKLPVSYTRVRISLIKITTNGIVAMRWLTNKNKINKKIESFTYLKGQIFPGEALRFAKEELFTKSRVGVKKNVLFMTNGNFSRNVNPIVEANVLKSLGVNIISIGIGKDIDRETISKFSSPNMFFNIETSTELKDLFVNDWFNEWAKIGQDCPAKVCQITEGDLLFIVDARHNVLENDFYSQIKFIVNLVRHGGKTGGGGVQRKRNIRLSLIIIQVDVSVEFVWVDGNEETLSKLLTLQYEELQLNSLNSPTPLGEALQKARQNLFSQSTLAEKKIFLFLSEVNEVGNVNPIFEAMEIRKQNIDIISFGIGENANRDLLARITSPDLLYFVKNFDKLASVFKDSHNLPPTYFNENSQECPNEVCHLKTGDILIILERNANVDKIEFEYQINFLLRIINRLNIGVGGVRLSLITMHTNTTIVLNGLEDKTKILNLVKFLSYTSVNEEEEINIGETFRQAQDGIFSNSTNKSKTLLLLSEGVYSDSVDPLYEAQRLKNADVTIVSVAVGKYADTQLLQRMSSGKLIYSVESYQKYDFLFKNSGSIPKYFSFMWLFAAVGFFLGEFHL